MSDTTLNDVLNVDLSDYTTAPYNVKSDKVNTPKVMSLSDVLRGTVIGSEWKTPTVDTLTSLRDRIPTAAEDFVWSLGSNTVDAVKRIVPTVAIQAMTQPVATTAGLIAGNVGIAAGAKIGSSLAVSNWWKTALGFLGGAAGGLAYGVGAGVLINELTPTETAKPEYDNPLNPDYQYRMLRELDDKHTKGDISDAEYENTKNEYLKFINDSKKILHDAAINKNEKNEIVDLLDGREYADASLVDSVVSWGAEMLKDNKDFRTWQMEQREMNPEGIANTAGTIIANLIPYYAVSYLYRDALLKPKLKTVYPGNRFREKVEEIPTSLSREQVTEKVENLAKAYATVQMGTDYAAQNILDYIEKTGDTNLVNYQPSTMQGAMSASYGAIGAMTEFELGGIEPLITGSFKKVGLKLPVLKAGVKAGGQEAVEEVAQNLEEFLARNIDDTNKKTWGELLIDSVKSGVWALLMGGTIGSATYAINRANLVKGIVKYGNGTISEEQATQVADTMIEMAEGTVDYAKKERIDKLKSYVSAIYSDIDMPEAEKADVVNSIAGLEYALISQWNTMNGTDIADDPLFKGEVNDLGWFRTGIPADAKERIDKYFAEIAENEEKKKNLEGWMEKAREAKNTELLKKLGEQLEEIESKIDMLRSDRYRLDLVSGLAVENKRAIIAELNRRRKQLKGVVDQRLEEKGKRRAIKSKKADVEFQRVYAAMRGELSGDALDFDRYLGYGEKASAWFGGNYALADAVTYKEYNQTLYPEDIVDKEEKYKTILDLMYSIRAANTKLKVLKAVEKEFKNNKDFIYKPKASLYAFEAPENDVLLVSNRPLNKQPKKVQEGIKNLIRDYGKQLPFLNYYVSNPVAMDELLWLFGIDDGQGDFDIALMKDMQNNMMESGFLSGSFNAIERRIEKLLRNASNNALNEKGKEATVKDLVVGLEKELAEIKPSKSAPNSFQEEYQDITKIVDVLKRKLLEKHKEDEVLTDLLSIYEPEFKDVTGKKFYDDVVHNLTILPEKIKQLKKDESLGILPNNPPQIIVSKLFRKYGIMGGRYYGRADGYGFVTFDKTPMVERLYQIDETTKISPLMYYDFQYRNTLIHLHDNNSKLHVVEPRLVLPDGNVLSISGLTISLYPNASNSPSESIWKFYESEGGQSLVPFRNIWQSLLNNIKIQLKGDVAYKKGSYEVLSEAENKELLLKALENTKKDLIKEDIGSELKAQIAVVDALIENIENDYIQPIFNEVVSLSDGTHLVTHGISGTSDEILEFLKEGKVYNPSLYIAEKPSEYGYRSVVLFARPDVLKDKKTKIYDRDAYTSALSREPLTYKTETPDEEKIKDAYYIYDKYFNADDDIYFRTEPTMLAFAKTMERGLENTKKKFTAYDVFSDLTKKYIIADALERGLVKVDTETIRRINNKNKESIPTSKLEELFGIQKGLMRSEAIIQAADKALDLIAEQENKTREEILDSYKEIATNTVKIVQSTGELATPANIAKAQRENKLKYGRWRDLFPSSYYDKPSYDILTSDMTSGVIPSIFTRELTFDKTIAEKRKTGRRSENVESRKKIHKYAILAAQGNLMAHGKVYAAFLPPKIKKTDVESYMRAMRYDPNSIVDHGNADSIVKEIEKMAKRFNKIFKTLTQEEQEKLVNGKVAEESDFEDKLISELEKNGVKNKLVLRYAVDLMKEVYYHPVTYFEGKILSDVDLSDFVGAYVNEEHAFDKIARLLEDKGLVVVRGRPSDVKSATIRLEQEAGEDIRFQNRPSGSAPSTYRGAYVPALRFILKANRMDASSLSHELAHDWFEVYASHALSGKASKEFMRSWGALEKAIGLDLEQPGSLSKASETFARAYEAWILNKEDWAKMVAISDKDKSEIVNLFKRYQDHLREIYNNVVNPYFASTWGKVGELKPELRNWFDRMVEVESIDGMLERGEITTEQADQERLNRAINTVIENTEDVSNKNQLKYALALNDTKRYEVEGGNKNSLQRRIGALAQAIDENNMLIKENYDTRRDMLEVARQADNFVRTRLDDALAIINGQMAEQEGLFKEDIYTALERLALENGDLGLLDELKNSEIANRLAKELGQRVAGFRNWNAGEVDVVSAIKALDNRFNKALQNKKAQTELNNAERMFAKEQEQQDKLADKELNSILKDLECK